MDPKKEFTKEQRDAAINLITGAATFIDEDDLIEQIKTHATRYLLFKDSVATDAAEARKELEYCIQMWSIKQIQKHDGENATEKMKAMFEVFGQIEKAKHQ